jgi:hypothetical protein
MSDDTVSVFEPPARNSGISSGRYLQRMEAPRVPGTKRSYRPNDCYMGQQLHLHERIFELIQADEWTLKYMEADAKQFPLANFNYVSSKVCTSSLWTLCKPQTLICLCSCHFFWTKKLQNKELNHHRITTFFSFFFPPCYIFMELHRLEGLVIHTFWHKLTTLVYILSSYLKVRKKVL